MCCPAHGWRYDVRTGQTIHEPDDGVVRFLVQVVDGTILVALGERRCTVMEDGLGAANTRRAMSRRVERVERGVPVHDETLMRLASVHAIGAITAQRWAARQPVPAWRVC